MNERKVSGRFGKKLSIYFISVADRVVKRGTFTLSGCVLTVERFYGPDPTIQLLSPERINTTREIDDISDSQANIAMSPESGIFGEESSLNEEDIHSCGIQVSGVRKDTSKETLKMFFENEKKSGGGEVEDIWYDDSSRNYTITFSLGTGKPL